MEQEDILRTTGAYQRADKTYISEGIRLLELAKKAVDLCSQQSGEEKRKLLRWVLSNSVWKDGKLYPEYWKPFDLLVVTKEEEEKKKPPPEVEAAIFSNWLPGQVKR